jgi:hypothetical protein
MTEAEWLAACDPLILLDELFPMRGHDSTEAQPRASKRYLIACARRAGERLPWCARNLVNIAEHVLDTKAPDTLRRGARELAEGLTHIRGEAVDLAEIERGLRDLGFPLSPKTGADPAFEDAEEWSSLAHLTYFPFAGATPNYRLVRSSHHVLEYLHECFANPFHDLRFSPEWLESDVVGVARKIHESREFGMMPVLADALEDAGCDHTRILHHCREGGPHIPGCWVLDAILHPPKRLLLKRT